MFGEKLKELRKYKKLTQEDIAKKFNVNPATVSAWEVGKAQPSYDILVELANYFDVTTDYLLNYTQDDLNKMKKLKKLLKEVGMWDDNLNDMSKEDFEKAIKIVAMMKEKSNE